MGVAAVLTIHKLLLIAILPKLDKMIQEGPIALERARGIAYRHSE